MPFHPPGSAAVYQDSKVSLLGPRQRMRLFLRRSSWRIKIRSGQEKPVRFWIELHRLRTVFGLNRFDLTELIWRVFVENVDHSFARRDKQQPRRRLKDIRVDSCSDRERLENFSIVSIHHYCELRVAA